MSIILFTNIGIYNNITKIQHLNINFGDVIDINTFIENYKNEWHEQELCKNLIKRFKNGERYDKKFYIDNFYRLPRKE
jgi:hypothetical protein